MTPVEATETSPGLQPASWPRPAGSPAACLPDLAGEGVGISGIDQDRAGLAALQMLAADVDRRGAGEGAVSTPAMVLPAATSISMTSLRPL